jgi:hypothetical protein
VLDVPGLVCRFFEWREAMKDTAQDIQPRRRRKGPVKKPPDRPLPLPDGESGSGPLFCGIDLTWMNGSRGACCSSR